MPTATWLPTAWVSGGPFSNCSYVMFLRVWLINRIVDFELDGSLKFSRSGIGNIAFNSSKSTDHPLTCRSRSANNSFCSSFDCNPLKHENLLKQRWSNNRRVKGSTGPINNLNCSQKSWNFPNVKFPKYQLNQLFILQFRFRQYVC